MQLGLCVSSSNSLAQASSLRDLSSFFLCHISFSFLKDFIYFERGEGRKKERERNIDVCLALMRPLPGTGLQPRHVPWRNWTSDPLIHRPALNPLSHTSRGSFRFLLAKACHIIGSPQMQGVGKLYVLMGGDTKSHGKNRIPGRRPGVWSFTVHHKVFEKSHW